jgi:ABC-type phosphate transport system substrate-binding protein
MSLLGRVGTSVIALALSLTAGNAMADVVAVVSAQSAVVAMSRAQLVDIFLGKSRRYPSGAEAVPVDQAEGSMARNEFYATFADKSPAQVKAHWSKILFTGRGQPPAVVSNGGELKKRIASDPAAIGYIDRSLLDAGVKEVIQTASR